MTAPDFTAHLCLRDTACRDNDPPAITEKPGTLCPTCHKHLKHVVHQLPSHFTMLHTAIGEHAPTSDRDRRVRIKSSRTPPTPINTTREALADEIIEAAEHAAAVISDLLHQHPQPKDLFVGSRMPPGRRRDSNRFRCNEHAWLLQDVRLIEPNLELLAHHTDTDNDGGDRLWTTRWNTDGTGMEQITQTGLQIIDHIVGLHDRVRGELGKRQLRHRYSLPCPRCGGELGRFDGETVITCPLMFGGCGGAWTDREYKLLVGLVVEDEMDKINKQQLDEANTRLDSVQRLVDCLASMTEAEITTPGAGPFILAELAKRMAGHSRPDQRTAEQAHADATARQQVEEQWAWAGERPYRPPKRKAHRDPGPPEHPVAASSRSLIADDPTYIGESVDRTKMCSCNTVHAGEC